MMPPARDDSEDTVQRHHGIAPTSTRGDHLPFDWGAASSVGVRRARNEDRYIRARSVPAFALADGMGGHDGGDVAATVAVARFAELVETHRGRWDAMMRCINVAVREALRDVGHGAGGSTLCAAIVDDGTIDVISVGDSRVQRLRGGVLGRLTTDHTIAEQIRTVAGSAGLPRPRVTP